MSEQITYYHDSFKASPFCHRVEIALLEVGASYTAYPIDLANKPSWFAQVNPLTSKVPTITYGGPNVPPDEPSPESFKLIESCVILDFLADLFPNSSLLPPASDPTARARVRLFVDIVQHFVDLPACELHDAQPGALEKFVGGLERIQGLLPDPVEGPYAMGKNFTNADCALAPLLAFAELTTRTSLGRFESVDGRKLGYMIADERFERLRQYKKVLWERECVKKVLDIDVLEGIWKTLFNRN